MSDRTEINIDAFLMRGNPDYDKEPIGTINADGGSIEVWECFPCQMVIFSDEGDEVIRLEFNKENALKLIESIKKCIGEESHATCTDCNGSRLCQACEGDGILIETCGWCNGKGCDACNDEGEKHIVCETCCALGTCQTCKGKG